MRRFYFGITVVAWFTGMAALVYYARTFTVLPVRVQFAEGRGGFSSGDGDLLVREREPKDIRVRLRDAETGRPIRGASVQFGVVWNARGDALDTLPSDAIRVDHFGDTVISLPPLDAMDVRLELTIKAPSGLMLASPWFSTSARSACAILDAVVFRKDMAKTEMLLVDLDAVGSETEVRGRLSHFPCRDHAVSASVRKEIENRSHTCDRILYYAAAESWQFQRIKYWLEFHGFAPGQLRLRPGNVPKRKWLGTLTRELERIGVVAVTEEHEGPDM